jgi:hypothetical protein
MALRLYQEHGVIKIARKLFWIRGERAAYAENWILFFLSSK